MVGLAGGTDEESTDLTPEWLRAGGSSQGWGVTPRRLLEGGSIWAQSSLQVHSYGLFQSPSIRMIKPPDAEGEPLCYPPGWSSEMQMREGRGREVDMGHSVEEVTQTSVFPGQRDPRAG